MNVIKQLWHGNICGIDDCSADKPPSSHETAARDIQAQLEKTLDDEQKKMFSSYIDAIHNAALDWQENAFCYGFRLGHNLALEATENKDVLE